MKKILFVTPYNPFVSPLGASSKSVRYRIGHLSEVAEFHLLTFDSSKNQVIPNHFIEKSHLVPHPVLHSGSSSRLIRLGNILLGKIEAFENIAVLSSALGKAIRQLTANTHFDLIHIDDVIIAPVMTFCPPDVKRLFFFHNLMTLQYRNIFLSKKGLLKKIISFIEYLHIRHYEMKLLRKMDCAVVLTKIEQERAQSLSPKSKIYQIPLEINLEEYIPASDPVDHSRITFTGTMSYEPNHECAEYFIKSIFPLIQRRIPQTHFFVVGMSPPEHLLKLSDDKITVTGEVKNIQQYINQSAVMAVPLLSGGGMRFKILEACALGKAVVSTSVGAEGIDYTNNKNIIIADTPEDFARQVCDLLDNPQKATELGLNARRLIESTYDTGIVKQQWKDFYTDILGESL
jgi:glycosyltransferase involved in cell wall biosynthesis